MALSITLCSDRSAWAQNASSFEGLGDLPGGIVFSRVQGAAANGDIAVGVSFGSSPDGAVAFYWHRSIGMTQIPLLAPFPTASAWAVSNDSVVVGVAAYSVQMPPDQELGAFRWTMGGGIQDLGYLTEAYAISGDGRTVAGYRAGQASRWTSENGWQSLGGLTGFDGAGIAAAISGDGSTIVGTADPGFAGAEAFRWTEEEGMRGLGEIVGGDYFSYARAASSDGGAIVGDSHGPDGSEPFRWTQAAGLVSLRSFPPGGFTGVAQAVSGDGKLIGGSSRFGGQSFQAFIWTPERGMQRLRELLLTEYELPVASWSLTEVRAISSDGRVLFGNGTNPVGRQEAWRAFLDPPLVPSPCAPDYNENGVLDSQDFFDFLAAYFASSICTTCPEVPCSADFNRDCVIDSRDFFDYLSAFFAGC